MKYSQFLKYHIGLVLLLLLTTTSCQRVIDLKLNNAASQIVIEGNITDQYGPQVVTISQSVPFTADNNYPPVSGAAITITDNDSISYVLPESFQPGTYVVNSLAGIPGRTYTLTVTVGGKTYIAKSTMPQPVDLDSLTAKSSIFSTKDLRTVTVNYQDPPDVANQYRFVLYVNSTQVGTIFTNDDSFTNGRYVREDLFQTGTDIHSTDTATVEMQCIDKNVYKYWFSLQQQQGNGPGGGTAPSNPPSNISNNALGYFSAHTEQVKKIVVN